MYIDYVQIAEELRAKRDATAREIQEMGQDFSFDTMQNNLQQTLEQIPTGWYRAIVSAALLASADYGMGLDITYKVIDGPYKDRVVKVHYNIQHTNADTMRIAREQITTMAGCIDIWGNVGNTDNLLNKPLQIRLTGKKDSEYNDVKGFKTIDGNDPVKPGTGAAMQIAGASTSAVAGPGAPPAPPAPPVAPVADDPMPRALADGWQVHPTDRNYLYRGQECLLRDQVLARYPAPAPPPPPPAGGYVAASAQYAPPQQPGTPPAAGAPPAWQPNAGGAQPPVWKP